MNWIVQFVISIVILVAAIFAVVYCQKKEIKRHKLLSNFNILFLAVAVCAFFLFMPYYYNASSTNLKWLHAVLVSFYSVLRTFTLDGDYGFFLESTAAGGNVFNTVYLTFTLVVMVAAPFFTFGVVLSFFKDVKAFCKYFIQRDKITCVFSELNERAVVLAKDLSTKENVIVFSGVNAETEADKDLVNQVDNFGAICFKKDMHSIKLGLNKWKKKTYFFVIGGDDGENLRHTLKLIENYRDRDDTLVYLFSTSVESELVLASIDKGKMTVRRVDEARSLINRFLYDEGAILFDSAKLCENGEKQISAVVVGLGQYGSIMLRTLSWFCQMPGYKLKITAFDKDEKAESKIAYHAPAMMARESRGVFAYGVPGYDINIHSGIDANTAEFVDLITKQKDATCVFVALGSDEENVKVAADLRMRFERMYIKPVIITIVYDSEKKAILEKIENHTHQAYDIKFIGDINSSYTEKVIIHSELEKAALDSHMGWDEAKEDEFWDVEYNYRSSVATVLHKKAKLHCGIVPIIKPEEELTPEDKKEILRQGDLEHRRWLAYMRSEGFVYSGSEDPSSRNNLAKTHHNMVPTQRLSEEDLNKDIRVNKA